MGFVWTGIKAIFGTAVLGGGSAVIYNKYQKNDFDGTIDDLAAFAKKTAENPTETFNKLEGATKDALVSADKIAREVGETIEHPINAATAKVKKTMNEEFGLNTGNLITNEDGETNWLKVAGLSGGGLLVANMVKNWLSDSKDKSNDDSGFGFGSLVLGVVTALIGWANKDFLTNEFNELTGLNVGNTLASTNESTAEKATVEPYVFAAPGMDLG